MTGPMQDNMRVIRCPYAPGAVAAPYYMIKFICCNASLSVTMPVGRVYTASTKPGVAALDNAAPGPAALTDVCGDPHSVQLQLV